MQKRLKEIDSIRAIAIISVIVIHVSGAYASGSRVAYYINQLMRYAVPVFVMLSGFSLYYADMNRPWDSCLQFYAKRLKKVFIPYIIWSLLYILYSWISSGKAPRVDSIPMTLLHGQASYHLYFIIIIMQLYLLYPLLRVLFRKHAGHALAVSFIISFYYQLRIYLSALNVHLPAFHILFDDYMVLFTWGFYFVFGMYLAAKPGILRFFRENKILAVISYLVSLTVLILDSRATGTYDLSIRPSVMLYSLAAFFLILLACDLTGARLPMGERVLGWISRKSFFIYFSHAMILSILIKYVKPLPIGSVFNRWTGMIALLITTSLLTFLLTWICSFIPRNSVIGLDESRKNKTKNHT
jgi:surface polysaccharide O-acyltransferase-like enzyme